MAFRPTRARSSSRWPLGYPSHANAPEDHAILDKYQPPLAERELRIAHLANTASLAVQSLGVGPGIQPQDGGRIGLAERVATAKQPEIIHRVVG